MTSLRFAHAHFIVNPRSSRANARGWMDDTSAALRAVFPGARLTPTESRGHAAAVARDAVLAGADLVVAVGGDGTINEVVNGMLAASGKGPALGIVPAGAGSDFIRTLGIPRRFDAAVELLARGRTRRIDVGEIECRPAHAEEPPAPVHRYFVNMAGCGASSRVAERFNQRMIPGPLGYGVAAAMTALDYRWPHVTIRLDGGAARAVRLNALFVCNGQYCGGGMHVGVGARVDDGLFQVVEAGGVSRLRSILQWPRLYRGLQRVRGVRVAAARSIEVCQAGDEKVLVDCDGEACGSLPATYRILPNVLTVCVP